MPIAQGVKLQLVHLKNSDANTVMALLKEVFAQGKSLAGKPSTPLAGKAEPESVIGKALTDALSITADTRTNTLVLAGTDEVLALCSLSSRTWTSRPPASSPRCGCSSFSTPTPPRSPRC